MIWLIRTAIDTSSGVPGSKTHAGFWLDDANQWSMLVAYLASTSRFQVRYSFKMISKSSVGLVKILLTWARDDGAGAGNIALNVKASLIHPEALAQAEQACDS